MVFRIFLLIITYSTKTKNTIFIHIRNATYIYIYKDKISKKTLKLNLVYFKISNSDFDKNQYLDYDEFVSFCKERNIPTVPVLYKGKFSADLIEKFTKGKSTICNNQIREGCVIKGLKETNNMYIGRKILKSISESYLLRKNATEYH